MSTQEAKDVGWSRKTAQELYAQREKRVLDAIALKKPDRVPILVLFQFFPAKHTGLSTLEMMYDSEKASATHMNTMLEFEPDMDLSPYHTLFYGSILDVLDSKQLRWAGHSLRSEMGFQFLEGERMMADEYDQFLTDPTDFVIRKYWPRSFGALKGLGVLPPIRNLFNHSGFALGSAEFALPDVAAALENLKLIGQLSAQNVSNAKSFAEEAKEAGFPMQFGGQVLAPFDRLSDYFRGTRAGLLDMYRRPTDVVKACEKIVPLALESAVAACESSGNPRVFIPLHKAHDRFMSPQQFERFYWPSLHDLIVALIDQGLTPCPFWQGDCTSRLETIKDVPVGKACYAFESTDMFRAKQILGDTVCIRGNVPLSILATGAPDDVHAYCKKLIDFVGKDGGFIMDASASLDDAKPENVKAMFEFTRAYGTY